MTKPEKDRIDRMLKLGCAACAELGLWMTAEVHHIVEGNRRMGHWFTIPLCPGHHRNVWMEEQVAVVPKLVSIAHGRKEFVKYYSDERALWTRVQIRLDLSTKWPQSKILPRKVS